MDFVILRISWKYRIPPRLLVKVFAQKIQSLAKVTVTYKSFRLEEGSKRRGAQQLVLFFSVWNSHEKSPYIILEDKRDRKTFYLFPTFFFVSCLYFLRYYRRQSSSYPNCSQKHCIIFMKVSNLTADWRFKSTKSPIGYLNFRCKKYPNFHWPFWGD